MPLCRAGELEEGAVLMHIPPESSPSKGGKALNVHRELGWFVAAVLFTKAWLWGYSSISLGFFWEKAISKECSARKGQKCKVSSDARV